VPGSSQGFTAQDSLVTRLTIGVYSHNHSLTVFTDFW